MLYERQQLSDVFGEDVDIRKREHRIQNQVTLITLDRIGFCDTEDLAYVAFEDSNLLGVLVLDRTTTAAVAEAHNGYGNFLLVSAVSDVRGYDAIHNL